jgi:arsenate reductase
VRRPRVLFVCVQNAGRSQIAQALYERRGGDARSAGSAPAERVHPEVVEVLREVGLEVGDRRPRGLSREDVEWAELVVTMGCGDACPVLPGKRYVDWNLQDPSGQPLDEVRALREEIDRRLDELAAELEPPELEPL